MIETIRVLAAEVSELLAVRPVDALQFRYGRGAYERALRSKGYPTPSRCAADCATLSGVAVDPRYCEDGEGGYGAGGAGMGFGYDAVLSLTKPPGIQGVAGTGASCASDSDGRPLWLVFALHESLVGVGAMTLEQSVNRFRGLLRHEALHGLGFVNSMFNYARDSRGERKHLIKLRPVVDTDGARDEVWMFVRGRAYELAQAYFECDGNATDADVARRGWDGLPLMGLPEAGRGAHWETRIMRDDVMSYGARLWLGTEGPEGRSPSPPPPSLACHSPPRLPRSNSVSAGFRDRVSSITLAALEVSGPGSKGFKRSPRGESPRGESPRGESPRGESPRGESPRGESPRGEPPRWAGPPM